MWTLLVLLLVLAACATTAAKFSIGGRNITLKPLLPMESEHGRRRLASGNATLKILRSRTEPSRIIMAIAPQTYIVTTQVLMEHNTTAQEYETGAPSTARMPSNWCGRVSNISCANCSNRR